jgi:glycosyltransferase involved in cell wall biosynthesis
MLGRLNREQISDLYASTALLCCTSLYEGFPNTFLEAWAFGRPVVSTFDPDDMIESNGLGLTAHDAPGLAEAIRRILDSEHERRAIGARARMYIATHHSVDVVMRRFQATFESMLGGSDGRV